MTTAEWNAAVEVEAKSIMESGRIIQLSEKFDAPQFAQEFLALAKKSESRSLHIMYYSATGTNPKTGKPVHAWQDYRK